MAKNMLTYQAFDRYADQRRMTEIPKPTFFFDSLGRQNGYIDFSTHRITICTLFISEEVIIIVKSRTFYMTFFNFLRSGIHLENVPWKITSKCDSNNAKGCSKITELSKRKTSPESLVSIFL